MNSSLAPPGPVVRNSLMTTFVAEPLEGLVAVGVKVGVPVTPVPVGVGVPVFVAVGVPVAVAVFVGVPVSVGVLVGVGVGRIVPHRLNGDEKFLGLLGFIN